MTKRFVLQRKETDGGVWYDVGVFIQKDSAEEWERKQRSAHHDFFFRLIEVEQ